MSDHIFYGGVKPSLGGNAFFTFIFFVVLIVQIIQGIRYKQWWFMGCWFTGTLLEVTGYTGRLLSRKDLTNLSHYIMQSSSITLAPIFYLAGIYYLLAQITVIMGPKFSRMRPLLYTIVFMLCDFIALAVQSFGGYKSAVSDSESGTTSAKWIMVCGLCFQILSVTVFQLLYYDFIYRCYKEDKYHGGRGFNSEYFHVRGGKYFNTLLIIIPVSVLLIYIRCIYRVIESAEGFNSKLLHEGYFLTLEAGFVSIATLLLTIIYPGMVYGKGTIIAVKKKKYPQYGTDEEGLKFSEFNNDESYRRTVI